MMERKATKRGVSRLNPDPSNPVVPVEGEAIHFQDITKYIFRDLSLISQHFFLPVQSFLLLKMRTSSTSMFITWGVKLWRSQLVRNTFKSIMVYENSC